MVSRYANYTGPQNKKILSVLSVRHMFTNVSFCAEYESKGIKNAGKLQKTKINKKTTKSPI